MMPSIFGENLFDDFFGRDFGMFPGWNGSAPGCGKPVKNLMKTDVRELENSYELSVDLPGVKKEDVTLDLKDGYLTIRASRNMNRDDTDANGKYIRQERYSGSCSRSFYVGDVQPKDVGAKYEDGILTITMPKQTSQELPRSTSIAIE
ncbi:MAG: Hsp20/alpha crystallin family protein [Oscillospiraceae bacterium]|nr:Hsp20/alpha crystallin family protein [Oscillospiraceae bacterium]